MFETITETVKNVIESFFSAYFHMSLFGPSGPSADMGAVNIRLDEIERKLERGLKESGSPASELYMNQALQFFFEILKNYDIQISVRHPDDGGTEFNFQSLPSGQGKRPSLEAIAEDVLDFKTVKSIDDMIGQPSGGGKATAPVSQPDPRRRNPCPISAAQIMRDSRETLRRQMAEARLQEV